MKYILSWLEEYSIIKINDICKEKIQNNSKSQQLLKEENQLSIKDIKYLIGPNLKTKHFSKFYEKPWMNNNNKFSTNSDELYNDNHNQLLPFVYSPFEFLNISENIWKDFKSNKFNIFHFDSQVGKDNILSILSLYIFSIFGLFNFINYS